MRPIVLASTLVLTATAAIAVPTGAPAPNFTLTDAAGKQVSLADFKGKTVVLEWNNPGCPFVQKHYSSGNMQRTQARAARDGAVWLTVNSGAPGKQGFMSGAQAGAYVAKAKARPAAYLLDPTGKVGRLYGAKTTPDMVVIDKAGMVRFAGAIDDKATADPADIATARNNVVAALAELKAGKAVSVKTARSYGCSVKYAG